MKPSLKLIKRVSIFAIVLPCLAFSPVNNGVRQKTEIVFCLDLSASTNGLLNDIRDNLWQFINKVNSNFPERDVRMGIVVFARPSFGAENNYAKVLCDMTEDYDLISYNLFQLKANVEKGDQCDGSALFTALKEIHWSKDEATRKMIYLFGNGNVKMCGYDYHKACDIAIKNNIPVNTVYCDRGFIEQKKLAPWSEIAGITGGNFHTFRVIPRSPSKKVQSDIQWLDDINENLSDTYIYYSKEGREHYQMMLAADKNSKKMDDKFYYARCSYKLSSHYEVQCSQWDLVSLMKSTTPDWTRLNRNFLPAPFQNTTPENLKEIVQIKSERRDLLMKQMRKAFLRLKIENPHDNPMDSILLTRIH